MGVVGGRGLQEAGVPRTIIGIKVCYYLIKIFLHNKIATFFYRNINFVIYMHLGEAVTY